ncbi:multiple epidermal growth factor-like domains protein 10 isoform X2 [Ostrea edulis]|uniref:multiple epidermal growth factor-like domains protein 10 isoform X2 n=1 Tax=Ostrea edulis TaxID=37623 RepID=UPI0024AEA685|nr:multiple epidermal growth factor-like domains protein 10 isoform X2 [Ostrea edulis]
MWFWTVAVLHVSLGISLCYEHLSKDRTAAQSTTWPCNGCTTYSPNNAVDGDISTCMRANVFGPTTPYKTVWWYVDLEDTMSIFNIRIQFKDYGLQYEMRQRGRMAGFSLYVSNTSNIGSGHLCYKDGSDLPPLDFSTTCISHGRYVIFYNERQPGVQYPAGYELTSVTELCEVTVLGCQTPGRYGQECDLVCSYNCQEQQCHIVNGTCLGCTAGWIGNFCNKNCPDGYYGMKCRSGCLGHCRDGVSCNHTSGECNNGCGNGWQGVYCDQACNTGFYGPSCTYNCSNCVDDTCNRFKQDCINGCSEGYIGKGCALSCTSGWFGLNCSEKCSENCIDQLCDNKYGNCTRGCLTGWMGHNCTKECPVGLFGRNCEQWCSRHCAFNDTCDSRNGSCLRGCQHPFEGSNCDFKVLLLKTNPISSDNGIQYAYIAVIVALITLNISTCGVFIFQRRRCMQKEEKTPSLYTTCPIQQTITTDETNTYLELHATTNDNSYQNLSFVSST